MEIYIKTMDKDISRKMIDLVFLLEENKKKKIVDKIANLILKKNIK